MGGEVGVPYLVQAHRRKRPALEQRPVYPLPTRPEMPFLGQERFVEVSAAADAAHDLRDGNALHPEMGLSHRPELSPDLLEGEQFVGARVPPQESSHAA
ncbi:MAG TPA: hypothetical protein VIZ60_05365 [Rubrobacter sp.]